MTHEPRSQFMNRLTNRHIIGWQSLVAGLASLLAFSSCPARAADKPAGQGDSNSSFDALVDSSYSRGTYQSSQVSQVAALTPTLDWTLFGHTTLSAAVPLLLQHAPRGTIGGGVKGSAHRGDNRNAHEEEITTSGLGDVLLGIDQDLLAQSDSVPVDAAVFTNIKLGTAEVSEGLGSGKNDYSLGGRLGHEWGQYSLVVEGGYTRVGDPGRVTANGVTSTLRFHNVVFGTIDGTYELSDLFTLGVGLDSSESYERKLRPPTTVNANAAYHVNDRIIFKGSVLTGLNNDSANVGVSLSAAMSL